MAVHRMVDFGVSTNDYGTRVCGAMDGDISILTSGYDCEKCRELTPRLQMLGTLERLLKNPDLDLMPVPPAVISHLDIIAELLNVE